MLRPPNPELLVQPCDQCSSAAECLERAKATLAHCRSLYKLLPVSVDCPKCGRVGWTLTTAGEVLAAILDGRAAKAAQEAERENLPL